jgi:hypothetical protein
MLRGDNLICGTSTTGTGMLTLAATPAALGAIDFYVWLKFSNPDRPVHLIPYVLIEYADTTYAKPIKFQRGYGTITLSTSLTGTTLARTIVTATQVIATPNYVTTSPTAITIGTAANALVFIGPGVSDVLPCSPYFDTTAATDLSNKAATQLICGPGSSTFSLSTIGTGADALWSVLWTTPMLVKRATVRVSAADAGASNLYFAIYEVGSDGRPGNLLLDLGLLGSSGLPDAARERGPVSRGRHRHRLNDRTGRKAVRAGHLPGKETTMKPWWQSKTLWFNALVGGLAAAETSLASSRTTFRATSTPISHSPSWWATRCCGR